MLKTTIITQGNLIIQTHQAGKTVAMQSFTQVFKQNIVQINTKLLSAHLEHCKQIVPIEFYNKQQVLTDNNVSD